MGFKVLSNVPAPKAGVRSREEIPFGQAGVDSPLFIDGYKVGTIRQRSSEWGKANGGVKFTVREHTEDGVTGVAVWRKA
jgi:hypothetical protein